MTASAPSILVADDNDGTREVLEATLRGAGYVAVLARNGAEAIAKLMQTPVVDAVLADVVMPEMSGIDLARQVKELRPDLPVVLMTGYPDYADAVTTIGAIPLLKPFRASTLIRVLQDCRDAASAPDSRESLAENVSGHVRTAGDVQHDAGEKARRVRAQKRH